MRRRRVVDRQRSEVRDTQVCPYCKGWSRAGACNLCLDRRDQERLAAGSRVVATWPYPMPEYRPPAGDPL